ncbi:hypothetical protein EAI_08142 [Harpegnathos saltator]|uniref:Uncharacterized protein n=1 Tax=Harpegnathos saltator TaxID=610380 RepID=E2C1J4_HARSA|nr:hypothetical protein EAI_08142 [Harpegnathos saltator]
MESLQASSDCNTADSQIPATNSHGPPSDILGLSELRSTMNLRINRYCFIAVVAAYRDRGRHTTRSSSPSRRTSSDIARCVPILVALRFWESHVQATTQPLSPMAANDGFASTYGHGFGEVASLRVEPRLGGVWRL